MNNYTKLKEQINYYFHNTYLAKYPVEIRDMLIHLFIGILMIIFREHIIDTRIK